MGSRSSAETPHGPMLLSIGTSRNCAADYPTANGRDVAQQFVQRHRLRSDVARVRRTFDLANLEPPSFECTLHPKEPHVDVPGLDNPVPLAVRDIVVKPQNAIGIDPAVRSDDRSVVEPIFLPDLTAPGLILEEPSIAVIGLDVELGWRELGCRLTEDFCKACGKKEQDGRPTTTLQC